MERLNAILLLALSFVRTMLVNLFGGRRGLQGFHENYAADRLAAISREERNALPSWSGCIACGLCNVGEGERIAASRGAYQGVMDLMLASSRSMPDYDAAARSFSFVPDERLGELEDRCPTRVPMRAIARFVRSKARIP